MLLCAPVVAAVPASSGGICGHADASRRGPEARSGPSSLTLTPARLPLRAQPAGGRARRGPGRGDVSADARVSGAGRPRAYPTIPLHPDPCPHPTPTLAVAPPGGAGLPRELLCPGSPEAGDAREAGGLLGAPRSAPQACWASERGRADLLYGRAKPCMMSFCLPPNCGVGVGRQCQLLGPLPGREATPGRESDSLSKSQRGGSQSLEDF